MKCETVFVDGECDGFHHKFDSCLDEALYEMALDDNSGCGDGDWQGYCTPVTLNAEVQHQLQHVGIVRVPAGFYIVHTATSGAVQVWTYHDLAAQEAAYASWELAYNTWSADE